MHQRQVVPAQIDVNSCIVRSIYGVLFLLEPSDENIFKAQIIDMATLAWRLPCEWSQWVFDDGMSCKRLVWLGCPRGDDIQWFEQRMHDVMAHFQITTHASVKVTEDCVRVCLQRDDQEQVWFSAGALLTDQWQQNLLSHLLGGQNKLPYLRELHAHEAIATPQTNAAKMARQLKAQQLWRDLSWQETSVL